MKKALERVTQQIKKHRLQYAIPQLFIGVMLVIVLAALILNTAQLKKQLQQNVEAYANDVSAQLTNNISSRMKMREIYIRNLADTFSEMPDALLTEQLLERKAAYLEMKEIFVLRSNGDNSAQSAKRPELMAYLAEHPELYDGTHIFYTMQDEVYFSAPILRAGAQPDLLVGVRTNEVLQRMIQEVDYKDYGICCIVDGDGTMIVSPTDTDMFAQINEVFNGQSAGKNEQAARKMMEDFQNLRSGVVQMENIGGQSLLVEYDFMGINDWVLVTLLSADLFSKGSEQYLAGYVIVIVAMSVVTMLSFLYVVWTYRRSLRQIEAMMTTDALTGGKNELAFQIEGEQLIQEHADRPYAILFLNLRGFKRLNEQIGVKAGDEVLRRMYRCLQGCARAGELVARETGDHFYMLLECGSETELLSRLEIMLEGLESELMEQFGIDRSGIARGAYLIREPEKDFLLLRDRAKVASTYQAEDAPCCFYDQALGAQLEREQRLEESFSGALERHEFQVYLQPKVCPANDRVCGGEVLTRWEHPEYGMLFPGQFIPLFERDGNIRELDFYMFEETCKLLQQWLREGRALPLSVNLSRAHLLHENLDFLDRIRAVKERYQIPDGLIELELTETMLLERWQMSFVSEVIRHIRAAGFQCSIDDFGFGYSSLAMLKDLDVTTVKLDRQFFLSENEKTWIVVRQLIQMAHELDITVVAEGVEDPEQVEKLRKYGCDLIQGYVYARPMTVPDFRRWPVGD